MPDKDPTLWSEVRAVTVGDLLKIDIALGVLGAAAGFYVTIEHPAAIGRVIPVLTGLVGVVIGAVIAGLALLSAFMDQKFLRTLSLIDESPRRPMRPFLFTVVLGVIAAFFLVVLAAFDADATSAWLLAPLTALSFGSAAWTLGSLLPALDVLVQFVAVQETAAQIDEESLIRLLAEKARREAS